MLLDSVSGAVSWAKITIWQKFTCPWLDCARIDWKDGASSNSGASTSIGKGTFLITKSKVILSIVNDDGPASDLVLAKQTRLWILIIECLSFSHAAGTIANISWITIWNGAAAFLWVQARITTKTLQAPNMSLVLLSIPSSMDFVSWIVVASSRLSGLRRTVAIGANVTPWVNMEPVGSWTDVLHICLNTQITSLNLPWASNSVALFSISIQELCGDSVLWEFDSSRGWVLWLSCKTISFQSWRGLSDIADCSSLLFFNYLCAGGAICCWDGGGQECGRE